MMQRQMLGGRTVPVDDLIRLSSEARRALASIAGRPGAASAPAMKIAKPAATLAEHLAMRAREKAGEL
jgi:hypothetical protein